MNIEKIAAFASIALIASGLGAWGANLVNGDIALKREISELKSEFKGLQAKFSSQNLSIDEVSNGVEELKKQLVWETPSLVQGWTNREGTFRRFSYAKSQDGWVHLRGVISGDAFYKHIFILPPGFRPKETETFGSISDQLVGRVDVQPDGKIIPKKGAKTWITLSGIKFYVGE